MCERIFELDEFAVSGSVASYEVGMIVACPFPLQKLLRRSGGKDDLCVTRPGFLKVDGAERGPCTEIRRGDEMKSWGPIGWVRLKAGGVRLIRHSENRAKKDRSGKGKTKCGKNKGRGRRLKHRKIPETKLFSQPPNALVIVAIVCLILGKHESCHCCHNPPHHQLFSNLFFLDFFSLFYNYAAGQASQCHSVHEVWCVTREVLQYCRDCLRNLQKQKI